jgi:hypothetical protein
VKILSAFGLVSHFLFDTSSETGKKLKCNVSGMFAIAIWTKRGLCSGYYLEHHSNVPILFCKKNADIHIPCTTTKQMHEWQHACKAKPRAQLFASMVTVLYIKVGNRRSNGDSIDSPSLLIPKKGKNERQPWYEDEGPIIYSQCKLTLRDYWTFRN